MNRRKATLVAVALLCTAGKKGDASSRSEDFAPPRPNSDYHVRSTFDADPSALIGRFVPDGKAPEDGSTLVSKCSEFVSAREVEAGGTYDVVMNASSTTAAAFGIPPIAGAKGEGSGSRAVRIRYKLTKKMQYQVDDPEGWRRCCNESPGLCESRFVSEFVAGEGELFFAVGQEKSGKGGFIAPQAGGKIETHGGYVWQQGTSLDGMYFAFKTAEMPKPEALPSGECLAETVVWDDVPPRSPDGTWIVGVSPRADSEQDARRLAREDAQRKATEMCDGVDIQFASESTTQTSESGGTAATTKESEGGETRVGGGQVQYLEERATCSDVLDTPMGKGAFLIKGAFFLPGGCAQ